jgi:hypothetical protein
MAGKQYRRYEQIQSKIEYQGERMRGAGGLLRHKREDAPHSAFAQWLGSERHAASGGRSLL